MATLLHILLLALLLVSPAFGQGDQADERPDILVILADDLGWHDVGFTGGTLGLTPNIDRLAAESTVFPNAYSDGPNCAPTRASLLTGLATPRHGIITVMSSRRGKAENRRLEPVPNVRTLDQALPTLPGLLQAAGWRTAHLGKFHVGADPTVHGFTDSIGGNTRGHPKSYHSPYRNEALEDGPEGEYLTDRIAAEAVALLEDASDARPVFMHLAFYAVHTPLQARADLLQTMKTRHPERSGTAHKYGAMLMAMDEAVGKVLAALERRDRPSVVVFASDNGGLGRIADNGPLRGSKGMLYEGGVRVPLSVRWNGGPEPASSEHQVILRDLAPTILDHVGVELNPVEMDGRSFASIADGRAPESRALHWHFPAYLEGGGAAGIWRTTPVSSIRDGRWKLMEFFEDGRLELYDLEQDQGEETDLSAEHVDVVQRLHSDLRAWRSLIGAGMPTPIESPAESSPPSPASGGDA